MMFMLSSS